MSQPQHMQALARANEIRLSLAAARRRIEALPEAEARAEIARVLRDPSDVELRWRLELLLRAIPGVGARVARRLLVEAGVPNRRLLADLTQRQRDVLAAVVEGREVTYQHGFARAA